MSRNFHNISLRAIECMHLSSKCALNVLFLSHIWSMGMAVAVNGGHSVDCSTGSELAAALANPDISTVRIQMDVALAEKDWKDFTVPVIVRRNVTFMGNPQQPPLLDLGHVQGKVQLQYGASFVFRDLVIVNWRRGSWRQAPGMDLLLVTPPGQLSVLCIENCSVMFPMCWPASTLRKANDYGARPASIPGNNTIAKVYPSPATCSNSSCVPPLKRCYSQIIVTEDVALEGQDLVSNGLTAPNGYLFHLRNVKSLCQGTMAEDCITRLSAVGCVLYELAQKNTTQNSNTSTSDTSGSNTTEKCVRDKMKALTTGSLVGAVVGGALGGAILIAVMVLVLLWAARRRQIAKGPADSASCGKGVTGKSEHQVIKMDDLLRTGSAGPCGALEVGGDGHDHVGCGDRHDFKNLPASRKAPVELPDESNDTSEVPAASAKEGVRPEDLGQPSTPLAADGGAAAISPACAMQPVTLNTSNRAELGLVVLTNSNLEQHGNKCKVAADSALPTPPAGVGTSRPAANTAPTDSASNVVTLSPVVLGRGACGRVYEGMYRGTRVAVKVVGHEAIWGPAVATVKGKPPLGLLPQPLLTPGLSGPKLPDAILYESASQQQCQQHQQQPVAADFQAEVKGGVTLGAEADVPEDACNQEPSHQQHQQHKQHEVKQYYQDTLALDTSVLIQLRREVEVLGRCDHPNVVRLLGACLTPPRMFLVMELAETSLDRLLFGGTPGGMLLPLDKVLHIAIQIAQGLEYLHPTIVHRDLKPANVLINGADSSRPVAKLSDFGLSRLRSVTMPTMHPDAGTPAYMAPECYDVRNYVITHHADMYSFGVLLWTMLTGQTPWKGLSILELAYNVTLRGQRPPMHNLPMHRCPPSLSHIIHQCWEGDPLRRPAAAEVAKELHLLMTQLRNDEAAAASCEPGSNGVYDHGQSHAGDDTLNHFVQTAEGSCQVATDSGSCSIILDLSPECVQYPDSDPLSEGAQRPAAATSAVVSNVAAAAAPAAAAAASATTGTVVTRAAAATVATVASAAPT